MGISWNYIQHRLQCKQDCFAKLLYVSNKWELCHSITFYMSFFCHEICLIKIILLPKRKENVIFSMIARLYGEIIFIK